MDRIHRLYLAAGACADLEGCHLRLFQSGGRGVSRLAGAERTGGWIHSGGQRRHHRRGCARDQRESPFEEPRTGTAAGRSCGGLRNWKLTDGGPGARDLGLEKWGSRNDVRRNRMSGDRLMYTAGPLTMTSYGQPLSMKSGG